MSGRPEETGPIFYRVSPRYWMNRSWTDDARLLGLYLLTSPHRTLEGLFWLPRQYVLGDLQWSPERLAEPFGLLCDDGFLGYDEAAEIALVVKALKYQQPANPNMRTAALRRVKTLSETPLDARFLASCDEYCEPLAELLREQLPKRFGKPQLFSSLLSSTPSAPAREAPVDNSPPVDNPGEEQAPQTETLETLRLTPTCDGSDCEVRTLHVGIRSEVARIVGPENAGKLYNESDPIHRTLAGMAGYICLACHGASSDPCVTAEDRAPLCRQALREYVAVVSAFHQQKPIRSLPAFLRRRYQNMTEAPVSDEILGELRALEQTKAKETIPC